MTPEHIQVEREGAVLVITLNRPEVLNSFNRQMAVELRQVIHEAANDASVRSLLLTGAGRAFCAGQDLGDANPAEDLDLGEIVRESFNPVIRALRKIEKPVVCAVNGVAAGAGANVALACDVVYASSEASFIQSFSKIGLIPDSGGTFFLPRIAGFGRASAMMLLGSRISAAMALDFGMVFQVVDGAELRETAMIGARTLSEMPTRALGLTKRALNNSYGRAFEEQLNLEEELQREAGNTRDFKEGVAAFLEKRKPKFTGE
ncbi:MAG: 2-(1,2-epoxy-1,2-dihydrophenyl)acetyl-CoA isomerase [Gemmatimonadaceae bacterium]|nr:2-(1,2-epoxy-1,2-dihydrophenyl)acetyl-CoA isomerase [Gemmatimonadaceae bacterium]